VLALPELKNRFEPTGTVIVASNPREFADTIWSDLARWPKVIKASGVKMD
jgi:tripartite-type tricarboxylate transporter receptor subunit TctC